MPVHAPVLSTIAMCNSSFVCPPTAAESEVPGTPSNSFASVNAAKAVASAGHILTSIALPSIPGYLAINVPSCDKES